MERKKRVFIVAEGGINHNGEISLAKEIVSSAKESMADAVKFQMFKTELFYSEKHSGFSHTSSNIFSLMKNLELTRDEWFELKEYADKQKIEIFFTPFDDYSLKTLEVLSPERVKIASSDINNFKLLNDVSKLKKEIILSTGMSTIEEVKTAFKFLKDRDVEKISILHCVSLYPTRPEEVNLLAIKTLKEKFNTKIGFSDHTEGFHITISAVSLGAEIIEKHFTVSKKLNGPDHKLSLEPGEFKSMVKSIRDVELALGDGIKVPQKRELESISLSRRGIYAFENMRNGEIITEKKIIPKRPFKGAVSVSRWYEIIGKRVVRDIRKNEPIKEEDFE